jgi:hypothetical protein
MTETREAGWRTIESAPKDGTEINAKADGWDNPCVAFWSEADQMWASEDADGDWIYYPITMWRPPLPTPPQGGEDER